MSPGPIHNLSIVSSDDEMKLHMYEGSDFVCLPEIAYKMLEKNFGGCVPIARSVIGYTNQYNCTTYSVEVYPIRVTVVTESLQGLTTSRMILLSRVLTFEQARIAILEKLGLGVDDCRFWIKAFKKEMYPDASFGRKMTMSLLGKQGDWVLLQVHRQYTHHRNNSFILLSHSLSFSLSFSFLDLFSIFSLSLSLFLSLSLSLLFTHTHSHAD